MNHPPRALFAGLCTLDVIQLVDHVPAPDEKLTARRQTVAAGGPAANAAATFAHLGGTATLLTAVGGHPLAAGVHADLAEAGVRAIDLAPDRADPPSVSSILVTAASGVRAVVSTNATAFDVGPPPDLDDLVRACGAVLVDGHHRRLARAALAAARAAGRVTVLDGGSWKRGTADLLPLLDVVACSADFAPPGTTGPRQVAAFLHGYGVRWVAVTRGSAPVLWWPHGASDARPDEIPVPAVPVVDTLGAGDVFHGALAHGLATADGLDAAAVGGALARAAAVASRSCTSFGTRAWMRDRAVP